MKIAVLALAAALAGVACDPIQHAGTDYTVTVAPGFSPAQTEAIMAACGQWQDALGDRLHATVSLGPCDDGKGDHVVCVYPVTNAWIQAHEAGDMGYTQRMFEHDSADSYLPTDDALTAPAFQRMAAHELGHAMGLEHTAEGTLMCADQGCAAFDVSPTDVLQWEATRGR
jgi:hypothetical protein